MVIHASLVVVPKPTISHLVMHGRQWVVRETGKHFPFHLAATLVAAVDFHLVLILVTFSPTFLLVERWEAASMVDPLVPVDPIQEHLASNLAPSGFMMSPLKFSIKKYQIKELLGFCYSINLSQKINLC
jgi:hypothetical protein